MSSGSPRSRRSVSLQITARAWEGPSQKCSLHVQSEPFPAGAAYSPEVNPSDTASITLMPEEPQQMKMLQHMKMSQR